MKRKCEDDGYFKTIGGGCTLCCRRHLLDSLPHSAQEVDHHHHHHCHQHHVRGEKKEGEEIGDKESRESRETEKTFDWLHSTHL